MQLRLIIFFVLFAVLPGLGYQYVQDDLRDAVAAAPDASATLNYAMGIIPNLLGGLSLTAGLFSILQSGASRFSNAAARWVAASVALAGLWAWEITQIVLPSATFDWNDMAWTAPGVVVGWVAARVFFPR